MYFRILLCLLTLGVCVRAGGLGALQGVPEAERQRARQRRLLVADLSRRIAVAGGAAGPAAQHDGRVRSRPAGLFRRIGTAASGEPEPRRRPGRVADERRSDVAVHLVVGLRSLPAAGSEQLTDDGASLQGRRRRRVQLLLRQRLRGHGQHWGHGVPTGMDGLRTN